MTELMVKKFRPAWKINLKWLTGILLIFVFGLAFLFFNLSQALKEENSVRFLSTAMAAAFSPKGLDDAGDINILKKQLALNTDKAFQPIPGLKINVKYSEIKDLSPREARIYLFRQLAEPLYREGSEGLAKLAIDKEMKKQMVEGAGVLGIISAKTQAKLWKIFQILFFISLLLFLLLIWCSCRFGRLVSPAVIFLLVGLPGFLLFTFLKFVGGTNAEKAATFAGGAGMMESAAYLLSVAGNEIIASLWRNYLYLLILGLILILLSIFGSLGWRVIKKFKKKKEEYAV